MIDWNDESKDSGGRRVVARICDSCGERKYIAYEKAERGAKLCTKCHRTSHGKFTLSEVS